MTAFVPPDADCGLCPRLADFRESSRTLQPDWHNAPVPSFGDIGARLLVVGLAPGLKGANRTGRPFTGDFAGDLLYATLLDFGFATGAYHRQKNDGLALSDCRITNAVRCVPPQNKPVGAEINACRPFLEAEIGTMRNLNVILALGAIAHDAALRALGERPSRWKFAHAALHRLPAGITLADSYHCSRYNTNTGRLTENMFRDVFRAVRAELGAGP